MSLDNAALVPQIPQFGPDGISADSVLDATALGRLLLTTTKVTRAAFLNAVRLDVSNGVTGFNNFISDNLDDPVRHAFQHAMLVGAGDDLTNAFLAYAQASASATPPGLGYNSATAQSLLATLISTAVAAGV